VAKKKKFVDSDTQEDKLIKKVMASGKVRKGAAIAILKSKGVLKQKKGEKGLMVKKKTRSKKNG
jgi:hypothetical protein